MLELKSAVGERYKARKRFPFMRRIKIVGILSDAAAENAFHPLLE
jgi:hypothetical protein